ncbi:hypothetical protein GGR58DRAFT_66207 [Xylaria digitata]|nr:hypothetical protein GGR58DRAFT_66207 [Xylaria digitata]
MKFISNHSKTQLMLLVWSSPKPVTVASHYFWAAGESLQNSQTGLMRTLLYEVLRQCPAYMPIVCPIQWQQMTCKGRSAPVWTYTKLMEAIKGLAGQTDLPTRFCFFIDGMDEYGDEHHELCAALRGLSLSSYIKLCVSSRPLNVFRDNFGQDKISRRSGD